MDHQSPVRKLDRHGALRATSCVLGLIIWLAACGGNSSPAPNPNDQVAAGRSLFLSQGCARCHGAGGDGDIGPRLNGGAVLRAFPSCLDQIRWVSLGSTGWRREEGPTYGATANPVRGGMPGFGSLLDPDQIRAVVMFTRVEFGGEDPGRAGSDCAS